MRVDELRLTLRDSLIGREIELLEVASSTNDIVLARAGEGAAPGLVVFAETQTAGRGQHGHSWESAPGKGIYFSVLLSPRIELSQSSQLTTWAAAAICAVLRRNHGVAAEIKAPNDVLVAGRKIAGVLVEMRARPHASHLAILGVGLNANQQPDDFSPAIVARASSLALLTGRPVDRTALALALLRELDATYRW